MMLTDPLSRNRARQAARGRLRSTGLSPFFPAVNFPEVSLPPHLGTYRLLHIHRNQSKFMENVIAMFSGSRINIAGQYLQADDKIVYVVVDIDIDEGFNTQRLGRLG